MTELNLVTIEIPAVPAVVVKEGATYFTVDEHDNLKIKAGSQTILNTEVPNNKTWNVRISLRIEEKDA